MEVNGKQYRIEWFGDEVTIYEFDENQNAYIFFGKITAESESEVEKEIAFRQSRDVF